MNHKGEPSMTIEHSKAPGLALGEALEQARLKQDLTQEAMADIMKLSLDKIIEMESYVDLSSLSPFDRGYVRNYAGKVELDLESFELNAQELKKIAAELQPISKEDWSKPFFPWLKVLVGLAVIGLISAALAIYFI